MVGFLIGRLGTYLTIRSMTTLPANDGTLKRVPHLTQRSGDPGQVTHTSLSASNTHPKNTQSRITFPDITPTSISRISHLHAGSLRGRKREDKYQRRQLRKVTETRHRTLYRLFWQKLCLNAQSRNMIYLRA